MSRGGTAVLPRSGGEDGADAAAGGRGREALTAGSLRREKRKKPHLQTDVAGAACLPLPRKAEGL